MSKFKSYHALFDVEDINKGIREGSIDAGHIRYLFSKSVQPLITLEMFPNIEKIHCPVLCTNINIFKIPILIGNCNKLNQVTFNLLLNLSAEEEEGYSPRGVHNGDSEEKLYKYIQETIYSILSGIGSRLQTLNITFNIYDEVIGNTVINIDHGYYYTNREPMFNNMIFNLLVNLNICRGLVTNGSVTYTNTKLYELVLIVDENFNGTYPSKELVESAKIITTKYIGKGINFHESYTNYLVSHNLSCSRLKTIVPLNTVKHFLATNINIREIHVLCDDMEQEGVLRSIIKEYPNIYYHIYTCGNFDSKNLLNIGDVKFTPLVYNLCSLL